MKRMLCLVMALLLCLAALPASAETMLAPAQWTEPFDYMAEDYIANFQTFTKQMGFDNEWETADSEEGYQLSLYTAEGISDIALLANADGQVLAIGTETVISLTDSSSLAAQGQAFGIGMAFIAFASRMAELDGDINALQDEVNTIQSELMTFQETLSDLNELLVSEESAAAGLYRDIEAAGHHMNFMLRVSIADMTMTFKAVFAPGAVQPE